MTGMKKCPYCGEDVKLEAIKCKHCQTMLNEGDSAPVGVAAPARPQQAAPKVKKPIWKRWWVWVIVGLLVIGMFGGGNGNDEEPAVVEDSAPVETIEADEPLDETESETQLNDEAILESNYIPLMFDNSQGIGEALSELGRLSIEFDYTDEWIIAAAAQVATIRYYADEAESIIPPEKYQDVHEVYLKGMKKFKESMDYYVEGVDDLDPEKLDMAGVLMNEGSVYINEATDMLLALE